MSAGVIVRWAADYADYRALLWGCAEGGPGLVGGVLVPAAFEAVGGCDVRRESEGGGAGPELGRAGPVPAALRDGGVVRLASMDDSFPPRMGDERGPIGRGGGCVVRLAVLLDVSGCAAPCLLTFAGTAAAAERGVEAGEHGCRPGRLGFSPRPATEGDGRVEGLALVHFPLSARPSDERKFRDGVGRGGVGPGALGRWGGPVRGSGVPVVPLGLLVAVRGGRPREVLEVFLCPLLPPFG